MGRWDLQCKFATLKFISIEMTTHLEWCTPTFYEHSFEFNFMTVFQPINSESRLTLKHNDNSCEKI